MNENKLTNALVHCESEEELQKNLWLAWKHWSRHYSASPEPNRPFLMKLFQRVRAAMLNQGRLKMRLLPCVNLLLKFHSFFASFINKLRNGL
jgi:hypothetical protein